MRTELLLLSFLHVICQLSCLIRQNTPFNNLRSFALFDSKVRKSKSSNDVQSSTAPVNSAEVRLKRSIFKKKAAVGSSRETVAKESDDFDSESIPTIPNKKTVRGSEKKKRETDPENVDITALERSLQQKYGSSSFKAQFIEEEELEEEVAPRKKKDRFDGFGSNFQGRFKSSDSSGSKVFSAEDLSNEIEEFEDSDDNVGSWGTKRPSKIPTKTETNSEANSFRLRKPSESKSKELANELDIIRGIVKPKEVKRQYNTTALKEKEKGAFSAFEFGRLKEKFLNSEQGQVMTNLTFSELGVTDPIILQNLDKMQIFNPTKIQVAALPVLLTSEERVEVVMQAQTGSGKTLAFLLPLLGVVNPDLGKVQALIIAPSRELVHQIGLVGSKLFAGSNYRIAPLIGGVNVQNQIKQLRDSKPQILVATPGRLAELVFKLEKVRLGNVRALIIDEVDNLLKEPFMEELQTVMEATPLFSQNVRQSSEAVINSSSSGSSISDRGIEIKSKRQQLICFASATGGDESVTSFADRYLSQGWQRVSVDTGGMVPRTITHALISCPRIKAFEMLRKCLKSKPAVTCALVFVNDPHRVEVLSEQLTAEGFVAAPLHGDSSKDDRKEILARLRSGRLGLVVTTELAARGIDVPDLTHVINYELPTNAIHYVHRAGRCGRAGREGLVINFANPSTKFVVRRFGKQLKIKVLDCEIRQGQIFLKEN